MVREIVTYGDPVLREKCRPVGEFTPDLEALAVDLVDTMHAANGVGLAAPQVGVALQLAVVDVSHDPASVGYLRVDGEEQSLADLMPLVFANPELEFGRARGGESEGCLSIPELRGVVDRPLDVVARLTLPDGSRIVLETDGLLARAIQHETDHLNGILFVDRVSAASKLRLRQALKRMLADKGPRRYLPRPADSPAEK